MGGRSTERNKMKYFLLLMTTLVLSGCAVNLTNRAVCTAAKDEAWFLSQYGEKFGVAAKIDDKDRQVICK